MIVDARVRVTRRDDEGDPVVEVPAHLSRYNELYGYDQTLNVTTSELVLQMGEADIGHAIMHAEWEFGEPDLYQQLNDRVATIVAHYPGKFTGVCSVDPRKSEEAIDELKRATEELGLRGLNVEPAFTGIAADDPIMDRLYEYCLERSLPVSVHIGVHFSSSSSLSFGDPIALDRVACRFPGLPLIGMHGGWPWVLQAIAVARRHPNVYLEYAGVAPKYFGVRGSGWEPALQFATSVLKDQVMFASDWPILPHRRYLEEFMVLGLTAQSHAGFFGGNAARLYGISDLKAT